MDSHLRPSLGLVRLIKRCRVQVRGYTDPAEHEVPMRGRRRSYRVSEVYPRPITTSHFSAPHKMILTNRRLGFPLPAQSILLLP